MEVRLSLALLLLVNTACGKLGEFTGEREVDSDAAFVISVLSTGSCPLPASLDPKEVTIRSYRVRLVGQHGGNVPANYFYASLLTTDGSRYLAGPVGCQPVLSGKPLRPGETREAYLNFPLPPSKTVESLEYAPALVGVQQKASRMKLDLSSKNSEGNVPTGLSDESLH